MKMNIIISLLGGAAIIFCLYLAANYYEIFAAPVGLSFLAVHLAVGKVIDTITGRNGFKGSVVMLAPPIHETGVIPTILVIWLIFSGLIFCLIWTWQKYLHC